MKNTYEKELTTIFNQQLAYSKEIVRAFINNIFGEGIGNEYKNRNIYDHFFIFNFDWLNYTHKLFSQSAENEMKKWCPHPITIRLDEIQKGFTQLTNIRDPKKLETISKLDNKTFRDSIDPDSMKIVFHILFVIYSDIIKCTLDGLQQDQAEHIIKNKDFTDLFKGDTMHSFHWSFGHPEYSEQTVTDTKFEYIFMYPYISGFSKVKSANIETIQEIKGFFNQYHILGNIVLTPAITVDKKSINVHRKHYDQDNYYAYLDKLFGNHDALLDALLQANSGFFSIFQCDREKYCDMLDILDSEGPAYTQGRDAAISAQDDASIRNYIKTTRSIVEKRCGQMIAKLYDALQD